ncbi:MAG: hypothetical protein ACRES7_00125 [Gammaproteobacteria bacterium]
MPANLIPPFEHACGASFVTDYLGGVIGGVLIKMPTGRKSGPEEVAALQHSFADAIQQLAQFYDGKRGAEETIDALTSALRGAAWHRENVAKLATPELALFDEAQT